MIFFKRIILCYSLFFVFTDIFAQTKDSIPKKAMTFITDKFPITRALNLEFSQLTPYQFSSKLRDEKLAKNKVDQLFQAKISANHNFIVKKNWMFGALINYRYMTTETQNEIQFEENSENNTKNFHYHSTALNVTYFSKVFKKRAIYSGSLIVDGSEQHFERIKGLMTATLLLKANAQTKMTVGLVALIDPTVQYPVIPTFSYEHKFLNNLIIDIILPKRMLLKKDAFENGRISIGSELESTSFYLYDSSKTFEYRQTEINSGVIYEHHLGGQFIAAFKTGMKNIPTGRIFEKKEDFDSYIFEAKPKATFYINAGISFNPFIKTTKK
jgi:hypothetical protein